MGEFRAVPHDLTTSQRSHVPTPGGSPWGLGPNVGIWRDRVFFTNHPNFHKMKERKWSFTEEMTGTCEERESSRVSP